MFRDKGSLSAVSSPRLSLEAISVTDQRYDLRAYRKERVFALVQGQ